MKRILTLTATTLLAGAGAAGAMSAPSKVEISEIRAQAELTPHSRRLKAARQGRPFP